MWIFDKTPAIHITDIWPPLAAQEVKPTHLKNKRECEEIRGVQKCAPESTRQNNSQIPQVLWLLNC